MNESIQDAVEAETRKWENAFGNVLRKIDEIQTNSNINQEKIKNACKDIVSSVYEETKNWEENTWQTIIYYDYRMPSSTTTSPWSHIGSYLYRCKKCGFEIFRTSSITMPVKCPLCEEKKKKEEEACCACYI